MKSRLSRLLASEPAIEIREIPVEEKRLLCNLMQLYLHDLSKFSGDEVNEQAVFEYPYLDLYWAEEARAPYFVYVDALLAGFVLVADYVVADKAEKSIAEFFIMKRYRKQDIGKRVAHRLFKDSPGIWEVRAMVANKPAIKFWKKTMRAVPESTCEYLENGLGAWPGPMWILDNSQPEGTT